METKIRLINIQLFGWHGVADKEKKTGQRFEIDIEAYKDLVSAINSDDINETTDYSALYERVKDVFSFKRYNLIEALASQIACTLIADFSLSSCKVIIRKPDAPINGILDTVEIEVVQHG